MYKIKDYTVESFRKGYCERYIIQARSLKKAEEIVLQEYEINTDVENGNGYFVF